MSRAGSLLTSTVLRSRGVVGVGVLAGLIWTAARVAIPTFAGAAVDQGIVADRGSLLAWYSVAILAVGVVAAACSGLRRYLAFKVAYSVETHLRESMFSKLQALDFRYHDRAQTGQLMARSATDLQQINGFVTMIPITVANFLTLGAVAVVLLLVDWRLALISLGSLPFVALGARRFSSRLHPVSVEAQESLSELSTIVEETVTGIRAVKGFGAEAAQQQRLADSARRVFERIMRLGYIRANFNPLLDVLPSVALAAVLWYGGIEVLHGRLTLGQLLAFNVYVVMLVGPLRMLGQTIAQAQRAVASSGRVAEILDAAPEVAERARPRHLPEDGGTVRFDGVWFSYQDRSRPVLRGLDLELGAGESVALVGETGSGKTTISRLVPRFYDPYEGRVLLDGVDVRDVPLRELRRAVSVVFEDTFLFTGTIADNIAFADPEAPAERIEEAAQLAGAHEFVSELPEGYETVVGERGYSLSGGQRQRLALARAILADPRVLILDDATSAVDASKEHEIRRALATVMEGRTTLVISHRPATIALATRVVLLDEGRIAAAGTHQRLLETCPRYAEVLAEAAALDAARAALESTEETAR